MNDINGYFSQQDKIAGLEAEVFVISKRHKCFIDNHWAIVDHMNKQSAALKKTLIKSKKSLDKQSAAASRNITIGYWHGKGKSAEQIADIVNVSVSTVYECRKLIKG